MFLFQSTPRSFGDVRNLLEPFFSFFEEFDPAWFSPFNVDVFLGLLCLLKFFRVLAIFDLREDFLKKRVPQLLSGRAHLSLFFFERDFLFFPSYRFSVDFASAPKIELEM